MFIPSATYRVQFNSSFGFEAARRVAGYLARLGVDTLYASPIFKARAGSTHGYDVTDPNRLNPELGARPDFDALVEELHRLGMGWLQDFVPNHMAYASDNRMLMDVFEKGPGSAYFGFFDIVWNHLRENLQWKLIAPFLGRPYGEALENKEVQLEFGRDGFSVRYYEAVYPVRVESYASIISYRLDVLKERLGEEHADFVKAVGIVNVLKNLSMEQGPAEWRRAEVRLAKGLLWELYENNSAVRVFIDENVSLFNRNIDLLDRLLFEQWFRLSYWRVATKEINYQRFFNINELISLRMEEDEVFDHIHSLVLGLLGEGKINGLRIDHVDGLYDPTRYLARLRHAVGDAFVVVEKILELDEPLPAAWPVEGTTGYEFMNYAAGVLVASDSRARFQQVYEGFTGERFDYEDLLYEKKKLIIERHLTGDLDNLTYLLKKISTTSRDGIDLAWIGLKTALAELAAVFPIYRTYTCGEKVDERNRDYTREAIEAARGRNAQLARELDFIERVLRLDFPESLPENSKALWLSFVMRFQQFTSPLMAKGLEDTTFYVYNRLISLNEVGGDPARFGVSVEDFHAFNLARGGTHPHTLNATATHDTKRGEDARARIAALSEMPDEWEAALNEWHEQNRIHKKTVAGEEVPDRNCEYFLYQTLVGALPFDGRESDAVTERIKEYVIKAARESKTHTFWLDPNPDYESALLGFTEAILSSRAFLDSFAKFQKRVAHLGAFNSLTQTLLKIASPGVPDFYQGSELWDFNLVDPDNRRPVDYEKRMELLRQVEEGARGDVLSYVAEMLGAKDDGRVKLFTIYRALSARRDNRELFEGGEYTPLEVAGERGRHAIAFARGGGGRRAVVVAPRLLAPLIKGEEFPLGEKVWRDARLENIAGPHAAWRNVFTGEVVGGTILLADVFKHFPLGLLISHG